ncbi:MAG: HEAT repeat domain-containing protein [Spirulina sp. SIO3F2]|nr:HEAT repeat domain-containing protein [Spirulina sp. SIO3F2]
MSSSSSQSPVLSVEQQTLDQLIERVQEQWFTQTFDPAQTDVLKALVAGFADSRGMTRLAIAELLGKIGDPATPHLLEALTTHPNPVVRRASGKTLTLIGDPNNVPTLIHVLLNDEDQVVKGSVVGALARTGEASVPALLDILTNSEYSETIKGHASWALSFIGIEAKEQLYTAFESNSSDVRCAVMGALTSLAMDQQDSHALTLLRKGLDDSEPAVRIEAITALGNIQDQESIPELLKRLSAPEPEVRKTLALALIKFGDRQAIQPLQNCLSQEQNSGVKPVLKLAITRLQQKDELDDDWD